MLAAHNTGKTPAAKATGNSAPLGKTSTPHRLKLVAGRETQRVEAGLVLAVDTRVEGT